MDTTLAFTHGFILALGLILPLGVQNVFIFNQGAYQDKLHRALPAVIAAALADTALILLAVGGVSVAVLSFNWLRLMLITTGVVFLGYMGWITWQSSAALHIRDGEATKWSIKRQVLFALSVSLLNPHAILDTIGVIGTSSLTYVGKDQIAFTFACILVSWVWFAALAVSGRMVRAVDSSGMFSAAINRLSAVIMWGSGLYLLYVL